MLGTLTHPTADPAAPELTPAIDDAAARPDDGAADVRARWPSAAPECPPTSLVGRDADLAELRRLTLDPGTPFVTLTGVGGVGKSRLAAELAAQDLGRWQGRVAFVPLDGVSDASLVLPAIAGAIGVTDEPGRPLHEALNEALTDELGRAPALLVLDTAEHVRAAAPALADLQARTPGLRIVVTSRLALRVPREHVLWIEPLPVPAEGELDPDAVRDNPAAELFLERALAARPDLETTPANLALVGTICRRLDGIPLAIELAAAALRVLAPHQLLDQLDAKVVDTAAEPELEASDARPPAEPARHDGLEPRAAPGARAAAPPARRRDRGLVRARRPRRPSSSVASGAASCRWGSTSPTGCASSRTRRCCARTRPPASTSCCPPSAPTRSTGWRSPARRPRCAGRTRTRCSRSSRRRRRTSRPSTRPMPSTGWTRPTTTSARRSSGRWTRATARSRCGSPDRWPSSGGPAAITPRAGCALPPRSRSVTTPRRPSGARRWAAPGCWPRSRATTASPSRTCARRSPWPSRTATTRRGR